MENTNNQEYTNTNFWKIWQEIVLFWLIMLAINSFVVYVPGTSWGVEAINLIVIAFCVFALTRKRGRRRFIIYLLGGLYLYGALDYNWGWINAIVHLAYLYRLNDINEIPRQEEL